ncbi:MAG TPA: hypothetical protein VMR52_02300 [Dehalococcoidia bacterium]|nr:hypothetical protein [Dehalococcoidia bacterium]
MDHHDNLTTALDEAPDVNPVTEGNEPAADDADTDEQPSHVHVQRPTAE